MKPGLLPADFGVRLAPLATLRGLSDYGVGEDLPDESVADARASVRLMLVPMLARLRERSPEAARAIAELEREAAATLAA